MAGPIVKFYMFKPSQAGYELSQEEQNELMAKVQESLQSVGGKPILMCDATWSSEQWPYFGAEEYPDLEAAQKHAHNLAEMNWYRYIESFTILGTKWEG